MRRKEISLRIEVQRKQKAAKEEREAKLKNELLLEAA